MANSATSLSRAWEIVLQPPTHPVDIFVDLMRKGGYTIDMDKVEEFRKLCDTPVDQEES